MIAILGVLLAGTAVAQSLTPTFVQGAAFSTGSRILTITVTLTQPVAAGDLLVGWFSQYNAPAAQVQVSDNVNGVWTRAPGSLQFLDNAGDIALYYRENSQAAPGGLTITVSVPSIAYLQGTVADYAGVALAGSLEQIASARGQGTAVDTGTTAAVGAGELVFAAFVTGGSPMTVTPGSSAGVPYTQRARNSSGSSFEEDITSSAAGAQRGTATLGTATGWYAVCAVFHPTPATTTTSTGSTTTTAIATTTTTTTLAGACNNPTAIPAQGGTFSGTTSGASSQAGSCGSSGSAPERVFQWTPAVSGTATIETCGAGTNFDSVLYLRSGVCAGGAEVGCNDDACVNSSGLLRASRITPAVTAGQTYFIVVDGYAGAQGTFNLTVTPPAAATTTTTTTSTPTTTTSTTTTSTTTTSTATSTTTTTLAGACGSPAVIPAQGGTFSGTTSGASSQAGSCGSSGSAPERVYQWTPAVSGAATIETCGAGTNFDSVIYMRSGACAGGPELGCNDDACSNSSGLFHASRITPTVTAGQTYFIIVDGYSGASGTFALKVAPPGASSTTTTSTSTTSSSTATTTTLMTACRLPATGQTTCWNSSGAVISCAGTGEDGELRKGAPLTYVDNGDGTVTDVNTGLMWEKLSHDGTVHDDHNTYTWTNAFAHVATLNRTNFAGHADWRLPNVRELLSIVTYQNLIPTVTPAFDNRCSSGCDVTRCSCTFSGDTWTSTSETASPSRQWFVDFQDAQVGAGLEGGTGPARAVRDTSTGCPLPATGQTTCWNSSGNVISCAGTGQDGELRRGAPLAYADNGNGTVTDLNTGLVWEKLSDDGTVHDKDNTYTWANAFTGHVAALNAARFAGYTDWRLPNVRELQSIVNYQSSNPMVSSAFKTNCAPGCPATGCSCTASGNYWSSTSSVSSPSRAWFVSFRYGNVDAFNSSGSKSVAAFVRAVRGGS